MNKKILMIDDDVDLIHIMKPVLEREGYEVTVAYNSQEGWECFEAGQPDVILMDLAMEHFDSGFVLCHKIKKTEKGRNIPIIMMTAAGHETGIRFSTQTSEERKWILADDYLEKPIRPKDLLVYLDDKVFKKNEKHT
jgi:CheY-like chemotaxis protein